MSQDNVPSSPSTSVVPKTKAEDGDDDDHSSQNRERGESGTSVSSENARTGTCKWFNVLKGWGFLTPDDGGPDVFVHQSVLQMPGFRSLDQGESVEFFDKQTDRGYEATIVTGQGGLQCKGSSVRPLGKKKFRRIRCFNCGQYGNHVAAKCRMGTLPKCCYHCHGTDHLIADCPTRQQSNPQSLSTRSDSELPENQDSSSGSNDSNNKQISSSQSVDVGSNHVTGSTSGHTTASENDGKSESNIDKTKPQKNVVDSSEQESSSSNIV